MIKHYINLTNGIEAIAQYNLPHYSFIRIQSTACEQHLWDKLILDLDYDFLMNVALGNECIIYDYGTRKPVPRAIYQGVQFIKFVLQRFWYGNSDDAYVCRAGNTDNKFNVTDYFIKAYNSLSEQVKSRLKYFKPFLGGKVNIHCITSATMHDGDKCFYAQILKKETLQAATTL